MSPISPIHRGKDGWYFWDESQSEEYGPYPSISLAEQASDSYARWLDGDRDLPVIPLSTKAERREFIEGNQK